jgi:exodeoxyribonuclease V alpha subunit
MLTVMIGLARQLFVERKKLSLGSSIDLGKGDKWPYVRSLLGSAIFSHIDLFLAEHLLQEHPTLSECNALFICFLSKASRDGHLCITIEAETGSIYPVPTGIDPIMLITGAQSLPDSLMAIINDTSVDTPSTSICRFENSYYLQRNWVQESQFIAHFLKIMHIPAYITFDRMRLRDLLDKWQQEKKLLPEQALAIENALHQTITLIVGGPGTGKTYTAGKLIQAFEQLCTNEERRTGRVVLAASTGRAASNLFASIQKGMNAESTLSLIPTTLHSLLGFRFLATSSSPKKTIDADLVIVDESSMLDLSMMCALLSSLRPGSRLVLLGDRYQLPAVESGALFADLIAFAESQENSTLMCELNKCMRTELQAILSLAQAVNLGKSEEVIAKLTDNSGGISRLCVGSDSSSINEIRTALVRRTMSHFPNRNHLSSDPKVLLKEYQQFRILSPLRQGPFGCNEINEECFQQDMERQKGAEETIIPIMITRNDRSLKLHNGTLGLLIGEYALFFDPDEVDAVRTIPLFLLPSYEYAYCLSVHKSQGSEFDRVLVLLPDGSQIFGREVLYTAVTRARCHLELWGEDAIIKEVIEHQASRQSNVARRLRY